VISIASANICLSVHGPTNESFEAVFRCSSVITWKSKKKKKKKSKSPKDI
jgi:hypothetical protein